MSRTSIAPKSILRFAIMLPRLYAIWRKQRKILGLSSSSSLAKKVWKGFYRNKKAKYRVQRHGARALKPSDHLDEDQDTPDSAGSSGTTSEVQFSTSPFSESGPSNGLGELSSSGPSTPHEVTATGPSHVFHPYYPHPPANGSFDLGPFSAPQEPVTFDANEESPIPIQSSVPLCAPIPSHHLSCPHYLEDLVEKGIFHGEQAYSFLLASGCADGNFDPYPQVTSHFAYDPSTVATTSANDARLPTAWYTPDAVDQYLPVEPVDGQSVFNTVNPVWETSPNSDYTQPTTTSQNLAVYPPPPAPVPSSVGRPSYNVDEQWKYISQYLESDGPCANPPRPSNDHTVPLEPFNQITEDLKITQGGEGVRTLQQRLVMLEQVRLKFAHD
jgi:hypothetical protein